MGLEAMRSPRKSRRSCQQRTGSRSAAHHSVQLWVHQQHQPRHLGQQQQQPRSPCMELNSREQKVLQAART